LCLARDFLHLVSFSTLAERLHAVLLE